MPRLRKSGRGDEYVIVNVEILSKLSKEQRELFEQLAKDLSTTPKPQEKGFLDKLNELLGGCPVGAGGAGWILCGQFSAGSETRIERGIMGTFLPSN